jgi:GNAT superfamily N-acetyltransferase
VPRAWSLVWLAGAHREVPRATAAAWRERWAGEARRYGQAPLPETFEDAPNAGLPLEATQVAAEDRSRSTSALVRGLVVPRLLREAVDRGWWEPMAQPASTMPVAAALGVGRPSILPRVEADAWARLTLASRVIAPAEPSAAHALVLAAIRDGAAVCAAVEGTTVVGLAITRSADDTPRSNLLAVGVAPPWRRQGLATGLLAARLNAGRPGDVDHEAVITVGERDPFEPLDVRIRATLARRLLTGAGFDVVLAGTALEAGDSISLRATRMGAGDKAHDELAT